MSGNVKGGHIVRGTQDPFLFCLHTGANVAPSPSPQGRRQNQSDFKDNQKRSLFTRTEHQAPNPEPKNEQLTI